VIEAFRAGLGRLDLDQFDYLCKLDMDLVLPNHYFARLVERMQADSRLGTCSGKAYYPASGGAEATFADPLISEGIGDDMSVGAAKFYRVECYRQIGGFVQQVMWDGIDCHRCRMLGWTATSWDDPELRFIHLRPMGSSERGVLTGRMRHGFGQYYMGTGWIFMTASAVFRMRQSPRVIGGLACWWGYARSFLQRQPRYEDPEFRRYLRAYHWLCLTRGKRRAMEEIQRRYPPASAPR
jgi:hypothetical protein